MRLLVQQVKSAKLDIEEHNIHREIWRWIIVYLWIHVDDVDAYKEKIARIMKKLPLLKCLDWVDWGIKKQKKYIIISFKKLRIIDGKFRQGSFELIW